MTDASETERSTDGVPSADTARRRRGRPLGRTYRWSSDRLVPNRERGSAPLNNAREEGYAQQRALGYRPCESCLRAGFTDRTGAATKMERRPRVQWRISYLRKDDLNNEVIQEKRRHLEQRLEVIAFGSLFEFISVDERGQPHMDWQKFAESDLGVTLAELRFDKDTGKVVHIARDNAMNAIAQLREMRGFRAADRHHLTLSTIDQLTDAELMQIAAAAVTATPTGLLEPPPDTGDVDGRPDEPDTGTGTFAADDQ